MPTRARASTASASATQDATDAEALARILAEEAVDVVYNLAVVPLPASLTRPRWSTEHNVQLATVPCELLREERYATPHALLVFGGLWLRGVRAHGRGPSVGALDAVCGEQGRPATRSCSRTTTPSASMRRSSARSTTSARGRTRAATRASSRSSSIARCAGEVIEIFGDGEQTRDFVFVRDTVDAAVRSYAEPATRGRIMNVASGREVSVNDLVRQLLEVLDPTSAWCTSHRGWATCAGMPRTSASRAA